jgi:uracil-DNA glycosylase family 4
MTDVGAREQAKARLDGRIKRCRKCVAPDRLNIPGITASAAGFGSIDSPVAIVGEALCRRCMDAGEPFVGGSGRILQLCFDRAGVDKDQLFITNSIHCHPPGDRDPLPHESKNCEPFLREELREIVRPRLVIGVGRFAKAAVLSLYEVGTDARELIFPFRIPRPRRSDAPDITYLLFPKHPYWIMTRPAPLREEYIRQMGHAIEWAFTLDAD